MNRKIKLFLVSAVAGLSFSTAAYAQKNIMVKPGPVTEYSLGANMKYAIVADNEVDTLTVSGVLKYWY